MLLCEYAPPKSDFSNNYWVDWISLSVVYWSVRHTRLLTHLSHLGLYVAAWGLGCGMSRGVGGLPVTCWRYRRIWGSRQRLWWLAVESLCIMCRYLHTFERASRVRPRKPVREIFRAQVQRGPPLCTSEDVKWKSKFLGRTTERLFEWLSLSCCALKQCPLRIWAGVALQTVFFPASLIQSVFNPAPQE